MKSKIFSIILLSVSLSLSIIGGFIFRADKFDNLTPDQIPENITTSIISEEIKIPVHVPSEEEKKIALLDKFEGMRKKGNYFSIIPPTQPVLGPDYSQNTDKMISYMKKNALKVTLNNPIKTGYISFKIKSKSSVNTLKPLGKLFLYIYNGRLSGYIDSDSAIYSDYDVKTKTLQLIFDVKNVGVIPWTKTTKQNIDLTKYLSYFGVSDYISTFWVSQYSSTIEEIVFVYDE